MGRPLPADANGWRTRARTFAEERVAPLAERIDREDRIPDELVRGLAEEGFLGLGSPPQWDGTGGDTRSTVAVLEELCRASASIGVLVAVHLSVCSAPIFAWGTDVQRERFLRPLARGEQIGAFALTEPNAGSDAASLRTRYSSVADGFVLRGSKTFISNAVSAGVVLVFATSDPTLGHKGISAFIVPPGTTGFSVAQRFEKLGMRGSETAELVLSDAHLPPECLLGREGEGLRIALGALQGGRVGIASCALGVAEAAFAELLRSVTADDADWKRTIVARAFADLASARALVARAAEAKDTGAPYVMDASVAKLVASRAAVQIAAAGVDVAGRAGMRAGSRAERLLRDARVFPIVEGTTEIQELILARNLLSSESGRNPL
ncbi:MAG TPA: acyl-CoA dehydrogenase family protein [Thermoplasmata archaeon]|nr:acyl-CoA dehydrogenase family protein [Thermoplasmata archaeon]